MPVGSLVLKQVSNVCTLHWEHSLNHWMAREVPGDNFLGRIFPKGRVRQKETSTKPVPPRNRVSPGDRGGWESKLGEVKWSEVKSLSRVQLFAIPWTVAYQAPPSLGFSRQEYWSGLPFPSPGDLPNPGIEPGSPVLQADTLPSEPPGKWARPHDMERAMLPTTPQ